MKDAKCSKYVNEFSFENYFKSKKVPVGSFVIPDPFLFILIPIAIK